MVLHTHKTIAYTHTLSHSLPSHKTTSHFQTNPNLLSLICWKHLLYVFQVEDLESSQIINVAPDGAIDHVLKTGWSDIRGSCVYTDSFTTAHFKTVTVQNMRSAYVQTIQSEAKIFRLQTVLNTPLQDVFSSSPLWDVTEWGHPYMVAEADSLDCEHRSWVKW